MARGFILILVATYIILVGADDLQEIKYPGKQTIHSIITKLCSEF